MAVGRPHARSQPDARIARAHSRRRQPGAHRGELSRDVERDVALDRKPGAHLLHPRADERSIVVSRDEDHLPLCAEPLADRAQDGFGDCHRARGRAPG
jgi:hypothetical protein